MAFMISQAAHRSIPACAGEPAGFVYPALNDEVYPRVCGGTSLTFPV